MGTWMARLAAASVVCALYGWAIAVEAQAAESAATEFVDGVSVSFLPGEWDGRLRFSDVYCVGFPDAAGAFRRTSALFANDAISLVKVDYESRTAGYVVSSTLPEGRTTSAEHANQLGRARDAASKVPTLFAYAEDTSPMGPVLVQSYTNAAEFGAGEAMFPLELSFHDADGAPVTVAESRVFTHPPQRFEVAALAMVAPDATPEDVAKLRRRVADLAMQLQSSLQSCTAERPSRGR